MRERRDIDLGFTPLRYKEGAHMCLIYKEDEKRRKIIAQYLHSGISRKEKTRYLAMKLSPDEFLFSLQTAGVKIDKKSLEIMDAEKSYCPGHHFDPDKMLNNLREYYSESKEQGYKACRICGEMHWALEPISGVEKLMEYEARVNDLVHSHPVTAICQYDARKFDTEILIDCLKVHPYMIINGQVLENPYYLSTEQFLNQS